LYIGIVKNMELFSFVYWHCRKYGSKSQLWW